MACETHVHHTFGKGARRSRGEKARETNMKKNKKNSLTSALRVPTAALLTRTWQRERANETPPGYISCSVTSINLGGGGAGVARRVRACKFMNDISLQSQCQARRQHLASHQRFTSIYVHIRPGTPQTCACIVHNASFGAWIGFHVAASSRYFYLFIWTITFAAAGTSRLSLLAFQTPSILAQLSYNDDEEYKM